MNIKEVYDFCVEWISDVRYRDDLKKKFVEDRWVYNDFELFAKQINIFKPSMNVLSSLIIPPILLAEKCEKHLNEIECVCPCHITPMLHFKACCNTCVVCGFRTKMIYGDQSENK